MNTPSFDFYIWSRLDKQPLWKSAYGKRAHGATVQFNKHLSKLFPVRRKKS